MGQIIFVGLGGGLGAILRYLISLLPYKGDFPVLTLMTNLAGAVLIGIITGLASGSGRLTQKEVLFWKTGVCGGFTTFSTFSLEAWNLLENGKTAAGLAYMLASVCFCIFGVYAGKMIGKTFLGL